MNKEASTQEKIIQAASHLFAEKGFEGTSVREIANRADVNLAAINYHFENKKNLYLTTWQRNCEWLEEGIQKIFEEGNLNTEDFSKELLSFFLSHGHSLLISFKLLLNSSVDVPEDAIPSQEFSTSGPPGGDIILKAITRDVGDEVPEEARHWAVRVIFGHVVHIALIASTSYGQKQAQNCNHFTPNYLKHSVSLHVKAILQYIKDFPDTNWEAPK